MTKNEKREAAKIAKAAALEIFRTVTVAGWDDATLSAQVVNYQTVYSPRHPGRRIVEAAAKARNLI